MPVNLFRLIDPPAAPGSVPAGPPPPPRAEVGSGWVVYHPRYRAFLRRVGVMSGQAAYDLPGEVVSGHADRHVVRVTLPGKACYLKREHTASLRARWRNALAGFGAVSRAAREAATLGELEARRLPGPQWLAHGADARGRAFLLVEELPRSTELRALVADGTLSPHRRRRVLTDAAASLAGLHAAGFPTPELAAKHVYVDRADGTVALIDWQSARPGRVPTPREVRGQLANLHASTPAAATPAERLRFLATYRRALARRGVPLPPLRTLAADIARRAAGRAGRSSVRDQGRPTPAGQRLVWLAGEAVCVLPELAALWPTPAAAAPFYVAGEVEGSVEEPVTLFGRRVTLTRFHSVDPLGRALAVLRERPWRSPAATAARVLFHLDRHAVPAARLLAFGQTLGGPATAASFVLTEAAPDRAPVSVALADPARPPAARRALLRECGGFVGRLHEAGLRLVPGGTGRPILSLAAGGLRVESPLGVKLHKAMTDARRVADLAKLFACEVPGLSRAGRAAVVRGYLGGRWADRATRRRYLGGTR